MSATPPQSSDIIFLALVGVTPPRFADVVCFTPTSFNAYILYLHLSNEGCFRCHYMGLVKQMGCCILTEMLGMRLVTAST